MVLLQKIISALIAFIMTLLPFSGTAQERLCEPEFNGTFIQSWMSSSWDEERWSREVENMEKAGIEYLILQDIANKASGAEGEWTVYYPGSLDSLEGAYCGTDVIEAALKSCQGSSIKVFVGLAMFDDFWTTGALTAQYSQMCDIAADMVQDIYGKYYERYADTFYGWYFTPEINNVITCQLNIKGQAEGLNKILASIDSLDNFMPLLLSPFYAEYLSSGAVLTLANLVRFFEYTNFRDGDIFAVQDAVGAKWVSEEKLEMTWKLYSEAIKTADADIKLWANCENFSLAFADTLIDGIFTRPATENTVSVTETLDRFVWQMDIASRYAQNIITFSYNHYYSPDYVNPCFINTYLDYLENGYVLETQIPSAPSDFYTCSSEQGISLYWQAAEDNIGIAYYRIERDGEFLARVELQDSNTPLTYTDAQGSADCVYTLTAVDGAGNISHPVDAYNR